MGVEAQQHVAGDMTKTEIQSLRNAAMVIHDDVDNRVICGKCLGDLE